MKNQAHITVDWKRAAELVDSGELTIIGSNRGQINNQGEFTISEDGQKLYKRRHTASRAMYDLIAQKSPTEVREANAGTA